MTRRVPKTFIYMYIYYKCQILPLYKNTYDGFNTHATKRTARKLLPRMRFVRRRILFPFLNDTTTAMMACNYVFENMHALCSRVRPSIRYGTREIFFSVSLLTGLMCTHNIIVSLFEKRCGNFSFVLYYPVRLRIIQYTRFWAINHTHTYRTLGLGAEPFDFFFFFGTILTRPRPAEINDDVFPLYAFL